MSSHLNFVISRVGDDDSGERQRDIRRLIEVVNGQNLSRLSGTIASRGFVGGSDVTRESPVGSQYVDSVVSRVGHIEQSCILLDGDPSRATELTLTLALFANLTDELAPSVKNEYRVFPFICEERH